MAEPESEWHGDDNVTPTPVTAVDTVDTVVSTVIDITAPLNMDEARELTDRIRSAADMLWVLIARAHAGRAWEALGYSSFESYVREEFDISRSRGYQLLNQARVVEAIEAATPDGTELRLSEAAARDIKGVIDEVVPEVESRTAGLAPDEAGDVVEEIVNEFRERVREQREQRDEDDLEAQERETDLAERRGFSDSSGGSYPTPAPVAPVYDDEDDFDPALVRRNVQAAYDLYSSLNALKSMPDQADVINTIPVERRVQVNEALSPALAWLQEFDTRWQAQISAVADGFDDGDEFGDEDFDESEM